jgi:serine/threonine protein kinase
LIRRLLVVNPRERLTAKQILSHAWLSVRVVVFLNSWVSLSDIVQSLSTPAQPLPALYAQLRQFQAERKGKVISLSVSLPSNSESNPHQERR